MLRSARSVCVAGILSALVAGAASLRAQAPVTVDESATRLTFPDGHMRLSLPVHNPGAPIAVKVKAELLDVDDFVLSEHVAGCGLAAATSTTCPMDMPPVSEAAGPRHSTDEFPHFRIRYTVSSATTAVSGTLSLDHIAAELYELHLAAPKDLRPGTDYVVRLRALHPLTREPRANVTLEATLTASYADSDKDDAELAHQRVTTDAGGFASLPIKIPVSDDLKSISVQVLGKLAGIDSSAELSMDIPTRERFELTTDKPLYQPGQTVHTRMLILDRNGHASAGKTVRVSFSDPDDTLVFRAQAVTSSFGIASIDWPVPARMRLGEYNVHADFPENENDPRRRYGGRNTADARIRVSRYDLPTFLVEPKSNRTFYLPGENATVDVHADYLFGKPVRRGHVRVVRETERTWDFAKQRYDTKESQAVAGELDASGHFHAHIDLSADEKEYRSHPPSNDFTDLHFAAYVTDASTGRTEERRFDLRITSQALNLYVVGQLSEVRGLTQRGYLAISTADGMPHAADITVSLLPHKSAGETLRQRIARAVVLQHLRTNSLGLARLEFPARDKLLAQMPTAAGKPDTEDDSPTLYLAARDAELKTGVTQIVSEKPTLDIRVAAAKSILRPGEPIDVTLESSQPSLPLHLQVLRATSRGHITLATRDITLINGRASVSFATDPRFSGIISIVALGVGGRPPNAEHQYSSAQFSDTEMIYGSAAVLFPRDNALHVEVRSSRDIYAPGDDAEASFTVRGPQDPDGDEATPAPSALGIVAVDEAVEARNRTDSDFGGLDTPTFFFRMRSPWLDSEDIGGFTLESLQQLNMNQPVPPETEMAAEILLQNKDISLETAENAATSDLATAFKALFNKQLDTLREVLAAELKQRKELPVTQSELTTLLVGHAIDLPAFRDPWGTLYTVISKPESEGNITLQLHSAGPDKMFGTEDDFDIDIASWSWFKVHEHVIQHALEAYHQRTGAYIRSLGTLRQELARASIDLDTWRDPWGRPFTYQFKVDSTDFVTLVLSKGDPKTISSNSWERGPYTIGVAKVSYVAELRQRVDAALNRYVVAHPFPRTEAGFHAAMRTANVTPAQLTDPWHHLFYVTFRSHAFFTDKVRTESHVAPEKSVETRTIVTPITAISDIVEVRSDGPDGKFSTLDDFGVASFSHVRSEQSAQDAAAHKAPSHFVHVGLTGSIVGTVTDPSGAVIPGSTILATSIATGSIYEGKSDTDGEFILGPLPAGSYKVRIGKPGFMNVVFESVSVIARVSTSLEAKLNVGSVSQTVEVSAAAPVLNTSSASVSQAVISVAKITSLPIANRQFDRLVKFADMRDPTSLAGAATSTPRLRNYFPETLLWRPEIITAPDGTATFKFQLADNITTWRLSAVASTREGNTGSGSTEFRTFQPFFAAFDPPSVLTVGDTISLPVALRNYLDHAISVRSSITPAPWFRTEGDSERTTTIAAQNSASPIFGFTALQRTAEAQQEFTAQGSEAGDRIARPVTVHPDGEESAVTTTGVLSPGDNTFALALPGDTLHDSTDVTLRLYPNLAAHLRDALTGMASYPGGCAEQIISIAWPSLLLQRYYTAIPGGDEKLKVQTRIYLQEAYENLLANQLENGGFAYWPHDRFADQELTAYAIEFLNQAKSYVDVDNSVIEKAVRYLGDKQAKDGRWIFVDREGTPHPNDKSTNAMLTASIAAMVADAPGSDALTKKAVSALQSFTNEFDEPYTLASYALATLALHDAPHSAAALTRLRSMALSESGGAYWSLETNTPFFGWGRAGRVETTALVLRALLASGATAHDDLVARGLMFLDHQRDRHFLWYSTQASARVLDVLSAVALTSPATSSGDSPGSLAIAIDGKLATSVPLPEAQTDSGPIFVPLGSVLTAGSHQLTLTLPQASQSATAQVVANFYHPWPGAAAKATTVNNEQLRLAISFGTTTPTIGKPVEATAHIERLGFRGYGMMIAEIGLPPGADVDRASLEAAVSSSGYRINHYEVLPDKLLLYVWPRAGGITLHFRFTLRYGIRALTAPSSVYDYYNPDARLDVAPVRFVSR